jgi:hypothetical protein
LPIQAFGNLAFSNLVFAAHNVAIVNGTVHIYLVEVSKKKAAMKEAN